MRHIFTNPYKSICFIEDPTAGASSEGKPLETKEAKVDLKSVIKDATIKLDKDIESEEPKIEPKIEAKKEPEVKKDPDELDEEQTKIAKTIYKALNNPDPKIQRQAIELLTTAAGLKLENLEVKKDIPKEATLVDLLKEGLGEYDFLAEKLAGPLEKALEKLVEKQTKDIREEHASQKQQKEQESLNDASAKAFAEFNNAIELKDDVLALMDEFRPSNKTTPQAYYRSLIILAAERKNFKLETPKSQSNSEKVEKNRKDANSRLASERGAEVKDTVRTASFKNLKAAVQDAADKAAELMANKR